MQLYPPSLHHDPKPRSDLVERRGAAQKEVTPLRIGKQQCNPYPLPPPISHFVRSEQGENSKINPPQGKKYNKKKAEQDCDREPREKLVYRLFFSGGMRIKMVYRFVGWNAIDRNIQNQVAFVSRPRPGFAPNVEERSVGVFCWYKVHVRVLGPSSAVGLKLS